MGAGLCRVADRHGRGAQSCDAAFKTVGVHDRGTRALRTGGPRRRGAGIGDLGGDPSLRAFAGGALQVANDGVVAGRNPSPRAAEDGRKHLASSEGWPKHRSRIFFATGKRFSAKPGWGPFGATARTKLLISNNILK